MPPTPEEAEVDRPDWLPDSVDPTRPSVARVYDFYLGGSHNFEADREFGRRAVAAFPGIREVVRDNRQFLRRAVLHACARGVNQFLDLGSGIPTVGNVHEVARGVDPAARVVYVDHDPVAVAHGRALLEGVPSAVAVPGDVRAPREVLAAVTNTGLLDLTRPVAVLMVAVLHFVGDDARPAELVASFMDATAPGSILALSHAVREPSTGTKVVAEAYDREDSPGALRLRTRSEIEALLGDLTIVEPGLVDIPRWHPELTGDPTPDPDAPAHAGLAGVGVRR